MACATASPKTAKQRGITFTEKTARTSPSRSRRASAGVQRMRKDASYADKLFNGLSKAAKGLQVTLRAEKKVWRPGEDLAMKADVRNAGADDVALYIDGNNNWLIELDGQWYRSVGETTASALLIGPGERIENISVPPTWTIPLGWFAFSEDDPWFQHHPRAKRLAPQPGRHTIRVAVLPVMDSGRARTWEPPAQNSLIGE